MSAPFLMVDSARLQLLASTRSFVACGPINSRCVKRYCLLGWSIRWLLPQLTATAAASARAASAREGGLSRLVSATFNPLQLGVKDAFVTTLPATRASVVSCLKTSILFEGLLTANGPFLGLECVLLLAIKESRFLPHQYLKCSIYLRRLFKCLNSVL